MGIAYSTGTPTLHAMSKENQLDKTKQVDLSEVETSTMSAFSPEFSNSSPLISNHKLVQNYKNILQSKTIFYPVAYRLARELGRGHQGVVFLAFRYGARGCVTRHAIKIFDPSIYPDSKTYWTDMGPHRGSDIAPPTHQRTQPGFPRHLR